jgi:hypothetical protein
VTCHCPACIGVPVTTTTLDRIAQSLAEHISGRQTDPDICLTIMYPDDRRPPTGVAAIKAELLAGNLWLSWLDETVSDGLYRMREVEKETTP